MITILLNTLPCFWQQTMLHVLSTISNPFHLMGNCIWIDKSINDWTFDYACLVDIHNLCIPFLPCMVEINNLDYYLIFTTCICKQVNWWLDIWLCLPCLHSNLSGVPCDVVKINNLAYYLICTTCMLIWTHQQFATNSLVDVYTLYNNKFSSPHVCFHMQPSYNI